MGEQDYRRVLDENATGERTPFSDSHHLAVSSNERLQMDQEVALRGFEKRSAGGDDG
jgi:hypothetical protein